MTLAEMERKLESLDKRVKELEAQRPWELHYHTHEGTDPRPFQLSPSIPLWEITCAGDGLSYGQGKVSG